ncbi:MAG: nuclear transport factor 2 family protein, partial [Burkholderiales bacterium]
MEEAHAQFPQTGIEIQRALGDGNLVAVHSRVKHQPSDVGFAVVHVFRFKGAKIVEFWDVGMEVPADSPNEHGAF